MDNAIKYTQFGILNDIRNIIIAGRKAAYQSANQAMLLTYWGIGQRIVNEEQEGNSRAQYGKALIHNLSIQLMQEFGQGFTERNLRNYSQFYLMFPEREIWNACVPNMKSESPGTFLLIL